MHLLRRTRKTVSAETPAADNRSAPLAFLALIVANLALTLGPISVRLADVGPVASGFWRITLAAPLLLVASYASGWRPARIGSGIWVMLLLAGIAFAADLAAWHLGIVRTTLANASLFGNSTTLFYPIYGFLIARAWPTRTQGSALLLAAIGAGLLMGRSYQLDPRHLSGDLLCVLAGLLYTFYFVFMLRVREAMGPLPSLALSTIAGIVPMLLFAIAMGERIMPHNWTPLIALALVSQVLGQGCMIYALVRLSPLVVGIGLLMQPILGATIGVLFYGERLGAADLIGAVLVAIALVLVRPTGEGKGEQEEVVQLAPAAAEPN